MILTKRFHRRNLFVFSQIGNLPTESAKALLFVYFVVNREMLTWAQTTVYILFIWVVCRLEIVESVAAGAIET